MNTQEIIHRACVELDLAQYDIQVEEDFLLAVLPFYEETLAAIGQTMKAGFDQGGRARPYYGRGRLLAGDVVIWWFGVVEQHKNPAASKRPHLWVHVGGQERVETLMAESKLRLGSATLGTHAVANRFDGERTPQPNEKCPCGSGLKFKKCHGRFVG